MSCKNCTKSEVRNWLENLVCVCFIGSLPVSLIGLIVVFCQSWDGYDYGEHTYVERSINWLWFGIFATALIIGITSLVSYFNPPEDVQDS